jgi:hypothetical protein
MCPFPFAFIQGTGAGWNRLELHVKFPVDKSGNPNPSAVPIQIHNYKHHLASCISAGNALNIFCWQRKPGGKRLHPRFILTELGGLQPDYGLDEGDAPGDTTIMALMAELVWEAVRGDFCATSQTFHGNPAWQATIQGTK